VRRGSRSLRGEKGDEAEPAHYFPLVSRKTLFLCALLSLLGSIALIASLGGQGSASAQASSTPGIETVLARFDDRALPNPTARAPVAALRLHRDAFLVKVLGPEGLIDEFVLRDPAGHAGVAGGWQLWAHRVLTPQGTFSWFVGTLDLDAQPNADFVLRIGDIAAPYRSSGDDGAWRGRGYGHGGMLNDPASNRISLNGGRRNLQDPREWPVGTVISGTTLEISSRFRLLLPPQDRQPAVEVRYVQTFGRSFGLKRRLAASALVSNVAMQDSPAAMLPLNPGNVTHFLPAGARPERVLTDGRQKPSAYPNPWSRGEAAVHQAYHASRPRLMLTLTLDLGRPLQASDGSISPWGWNASVRYFFTDNPDYAKYYVMAASSAEDPAARAPHRLVPGVVYETQSSLRTVLADRPAQ
jgi:hypothetical protein